MYRRNKKYAIYYLTTAFVGYIFYLSLFAILFFIIKNFCGPLSPIIKIVLVYICPILTSLYGLMNAININIHRVKIKNSEINRDIKICHLSDIHLGPIYQRNFIKEIVEDINEIKPDFVVITGDIFDGSYRVDASWLFPFQEVKVPIYFVKGNHEYYYDQSFGDPLEIIKKTNIQIISEDNPIVFENIIIYGHHFKDFMTDHAEITKLCESIPRKEGFMNIVLQHIPSVNLRNLVKTNVDLMLCGHTHAGQIFPLNIFIFLGNACFSGLYKKKDHYVYVSEGVGSSTIPMRVMTRSIIGVINICKN